VVTNIDREHMDCYRNMRDVKKTFLEFMDRVPFYGMVVACNDDPLLRRIAAGGAAAHGDVWNEARIGFLDQAGNGWRAGNVCGNAGSR
jgi:UDP-N-acetylmuramate-alanine ligase